MVGVVEDGRWGCAERLLSDFILTSTTQLEQLSSHEKEMLTIQRTVRFVCECGNYRNNEHPERNHVIPCITLTLAHFLGAGRQRSTMELQMGVDRYVQQFNGLRRINNQSADAVVDISSSDDESNRARGPTVPGTICACGAMPTARSYQDTYPKWLFIGFDAAKKQRN